MVVLARVLAVWLAFATCFPGAAPAAALEAPCSDGLPGPGPLDTPVGAPDPMTDGPAVVVPPAEDPPRTQVVLDAGAEVDLVAVAAEDGAALTDARTWYEATRAGSAVGLPIVREPGRLVRLVPAASRPWSSTFWPSVDGGLAFGGVYSYTKPHGLSPLEAYDTYVYNRSGWRRNPRAAFWEAVAEGLGSDPRTGWFYHDLSPLWLYGPPTDQVPDPRLAERAKRNWFGHCNAWSAAAVLAPEPPARTVVPLQQNLRLLKLKKRKPEEWTRQDNEDPIGAYRMEERAERQMVLTRADLVGILTEAHMGATALDFTGGTWVQQQNAANLRRRLTDFRRGTGMGGEAIDEAAGGLPDSSRPGTLVPYGLDVSGGLESLSAADRQRWMDPMPHNLHLILLATVVGRGKAVAGDVDANAQVDNHPIFGYAYKRNYVEDGDRRYYLFHARIRFATYQNDPASPGTRARDIDCHFRVNLDAAGRILSSEWLGPSGNPVHKLAHVDQIWFPKSFTAGTFYGNRNLDDSVVRELIKLYAPPR